MFQKGTNTTQLILKRMFSKEILFETTMFWRYDPFSQKLIRKIQKMLENVEKQHNLGSSFGQIQQKQ